MKKKSLSLILVTAVAASMLMGTVFADDISWDGAFDAPPAVETNNPDEQDVAVFIDGKETAQEEGLFSEEDAIIEEAIVGEEVAAEQTEFEVENASFEATDEDTAIISENAGESSSLAVAAQGLVYTGEPQELLIVNAEQGYVEYSLDGENFSSEIPAATNAGLYNVYIRSAEGDEIQTVSVVIDKADVIFTPPVPNTTADTQN